MKFKIPSKPFLTYGGANLDHKKNTSQKNSIVMSTPDEVIIPVLQHLGKPCISIIKKGDQVLLGQKIAENTDYLSVPIHASISGTVKLIKKIILPNNQIVDAIIIKSDNKMTISDTVKPPKIDTLNDFINSIKESGLVGLGGAGFPTYIKLSIPKGKKAEILIINSAECEPYLTSDNRTAIEDTDDIINGINIVKNYLNIKNAIIAIENNKPIAIEKLKNKIKKNSNISILELKSQYPQGAEKVLIQACTGYRLPSDKLPIDIGCLVLNITSIAFISKYIKTGIPLISKRLTIDGSAIKNPQNIISPIGTKISSIIEFCGGYKETPHKIIMGGPMMGFTLKNDTFPILKQNNGILAFNEKESKNYEPTPCIRCGRCVESCPILLTPFLLEKFTEYNKIDKLQEYKIMSCMECGTCAFNCPSKRPLVQSIRLGKHLIKTKGE